VKHAIIGTVLVLYGLFLTPCAVDPLDILTTPALIVAATSMGVPAFIITLWIISGYLALIAGSVLLGHSIIRHIPAIVSGTKNPIALLLLIIFIVSVICLWFYYVA